MPETLIVDGFKAFSSRQEIPLNRLTLLFGANSAGKSSVIHAMLALHHAAETRTASFDIRRPSLSASRLDLGGFGNIANRREHRRTTLGLVFDPEDCAEPSNSDVFGPREFPGPVVPRIVGVEFTSKSGPIDGITVTYDNQLVATFAVSEHPFFVLKTFASSHPAFAHFPRGKPKAPKARGQPQKQRTVKFVVSEHESTLGEEVAQAKGEAFRLFRDFSEDEFLTGLAEILDWTLNATRRAALELIHLGPIRDVPPRFFGGDRDEAQASEVTSEGDLAWQTLLGDEGVRSKVNSWLRDRRILGRPIELETRHLVVFEDMMNAVAQHQGAFFRETPKRVMREAQNFSMPPRPFLSVKDIGAGRAGSLHDLGCGVSQVLPVLTYALAPSGRLVAVEQPELHVHPAAQADLADMFISASADEDRRAGNRFLLETHSEHLILRILRRIRETAKGIAPEEFRLSPSEVSVLFLSPSREGSKEGAWVTYMPIDEHGEFTEPWPDGFLPDRLKEL